MKEIKIDPNKATKYQTVKRCLNCAYINAKTSSICTGCNLMLVSELNDDEKDKDQYFRKVLPSKGEKADKEIFSSRPRREDE